MTLPWFFTRSPALQAHPFRVLKALPQAGSKMLSSNLPEIFHIHFYFHNTLQCEVPQVFHFYDNLS